MRPVLKRNTSQRTAMEEILRRAERPLGIREILEQGRARVPSLNQATVYRNLKLLVDEGRLIMITHPTLGTLYEQAGKDHHHHFHCRVCDKVFVLPGCPLMEGASSPPGFVTEEHEVYLFGVCAACSTRPV